MTLIAIAFAGGAVVEYFFGVIAKVVAFAKSVWAKIRGAV